MIECPKCHHVWDNHPSEPIREVYKSDEERFWSKVDKSGDCWLWKGRKRGGRSDGTLSNESGAFDLTHGRVIQAHRYSWTLAYGEIPEGMLIMHKCGNPMCVRPDHLVIGEYADQNQCQKALTSEQIDDIGRRYITNKKGRYGKITIAILSQEYGVSQPVIRKAIQEYRRKVSEDTSDEFPDYDTSDT